MVTVVRGVFFAIKLFASLNVSYKFQKITLTSPFANKEEVLIASTCTREKSWFLMAPDELSTAAVRRLIEMAGADRVGDDAVEELGKILEDFAIKVGKEATGLARHAGRKTVKAQDIQLAIKRVPPP
jgi:histone H3/H4